MPSRFCWFFGTSWRHFGVAFRPPLGHIAVILVLLSADLAFSETGPMDTRDGLIVESFLVLVFMAMRRYGYGYCCCMNVALSSRPNCKDKLGQHCSHSSYGHGGSLP